MEGRRSGRCEGKLWSCEGEEGVEVRCGGGQEGMEVWR